MTDAIAERVRKIGGSTVKSVGHISRLQRVTDNDVDYVQPQDMLAEVREDNKGLAARLREAHNVCEEHRDIATASLIEVWIARPSDGPGFCSRLLARQNPPNLERGSAAGGRVLALMPAQSAFSAFHHRTFAVLWTATVVSNIGGWMYSAASAWLMTTLERVRSQSRWCRWRRACRPSCSRCWRVRSRTSSTSGAC